MKNVVLDQNAAGALLYGALFLIVALRPRARRPEKYHRGIPLFSRGAAREGMSSTAAAQPGSAVRSLFPELPRSAWMSASLLLLCGVGVASAVMVSASSSAYNTAVAANSPATFYHLDETGGGTAADASGNGNSGTYGSSGITYSASGAMTGDAAISTTGTSTVVTASDASLPTGNSNRSVELWESTTGTGWQDLVNYGTHSGNSAFFVILNGSEIILSQWGSALYFPTTVSLNDGGWHQIAVTYASSTDMHTVYVDGQLVGAQSYGAALGTASVGTAGLNVGGGVNGNFAGSLDEVSVYGSTLAAADVSGHWQAAVDAGSCPATPTTGYAGAVAGDLPLRYWRLGDSSRAALDFSGNCKPAAYGTGVTHVTGAISGDSNTAVSSPTGGGAMLSASADALPSGAAARTVELWMQSTTSGGDLVDYGTHAVNDAFYLVLSASSTVTFSQWGSSYSFSTPYSLTDGSWHHLALTYDGATAMTLYVDGQRLATDTLATALTTDVSGPNLVVGTGNDGNFTGAIDELAVYGSALASANVNTHWRSGVAAASCPGTPSGGYAGAVAGDAPTRYFRLDESAPAAADSSGNCQFAAFGPGITHPNGALSSAAGKSIGSASGGGTMLSASSAGLPAGASARTVEFWMQSTTTGGDLLDYGTQSINQSFVLLLSGASTVTFSQWGSSYSFGTPYSLTDGNWHYLALTYDGSTAITLYVDGKSSGTDTLASALATDPTGANLLVGTGANGSFLGNVDELATYATMLSAAQVTAHVKASGNPIGGPLLAAAASTGNQNSLMANNCGQVQATGNPVDTATGNFWHSFEDLTLPGRSCPLAFSRQYNSQAAATSGALGYGWTLNYGMGLAVSGSTATVTDEHGSQSTFTLSGGTWSPSAPRYIATLVHNADSTWTLVRFGTWTYTFSSSGQLTSKKDLNGYTTTFGYTGSNLTSVTDEAGRTLTIGWTGSNITSVTDANVSPSRVVTYQYNDTFGNLTDVIDDRGNTQHFVYDTNHLMTVMKDPKCQRACVKSSRAALLR